jgi:hypothetical protein
MLSKLKSIVVCYVANGRREACNLKNNNVLRFPHREKKRILDWIWIWLWLQAIDSNETKLSINLFVWWCTPFPLKLKRRNSRSFADDQVADLLDCNKSACPNDQWWHVSGIWSWKWDQIFENLYLHNVSRKFSIILPNMIATKKLNVKTCNYLNQQSHIRVIAIFFLAFGCHKSLT